MSEPGENLWESFRNRTIFAFHGNTESRIAHAEQHGFRREGLPGDWLGGGWYFWQEAPIRAWQWADHVVALEARRNPENPAPAPMVLIAELQHSDNWMDLIEASPWFDRLRRVARALELRGVLPDQSPNLAASVLHERDFAVIEATMNELRRAGLTVDAIRGAFVEGEAVHEHSAIYDKAHVQIAVRNPELIRRCRRIQRP